MARRHIISGINSQPMEPEFIAPVLDNVALGFVTGASPAALSALKWLTSTEKSMADVKAYAMRLEAAWKNLWTMDVKPWTDSEEFATTTLQKQSLNKLFDDEEDVTPILLGDVLATPNADPATVSAKKAKYALLDKLSIDRAKFLTYQKKDLEKTIGAPSPAIAWDELKVFEKTLHADREALSSYRKLASEDPGDLENNKPAVKTWVYVAGTGALGVFVYALYRLFRREPPLNGYRYR